MTSMIPSRTTRTLAGKEHPAYSMNFVVTDRELLSRSPEKIVEWIAKVAERNLYFLKSQMVLDGLDTGDEA